MASCVYRKTEGPVALPNGGKEGGKWGKEKREEGIGDVRKQTSYEARLSLPHTMRYPI